MAANTTCLFIGFLRLPLYYFFLWNFIEKKYIACISQEMNLIVQIKKLLYISTRTFDLHDRDMSG